MASTSLSQRWLSEVEATGTLINRKSLARYMAKDHRRNQAIAYNVT